MRDRGDCQAARRYRTVTFTGREHISESGQATSARNDPPHSLFS